MANSVLSMSNVNSKGIGSQRSLEAEDIGEFATLTLMQKIS